MERRKCNICHRKPARKKRRMCHRCAKRKWRKTNPYPAAFARLKDKAKARRSKRWPAGIPVAITLAAFTIWARRTQLLTRTGNEAGSLTIDRRDHTRGYEPGNLRAITRRENCIKQAKEQGKRFEAGFAWQIK